MSELLNEDWSRIKCDRCGRRMRKPDGWNATMTAGQMTGATCPTCQTPEDNAEAEINAATLDYHLPDSEGRLRAHAKGVAPPIFTTHDEIAQDLIRRSEVAVEKIARLAVDTGVAFTVDDIVDAVEDALPPDYPAPTVGTGTRRDVIAEMAGEIISGDLYE